MFTPNKHGLVVEQGSISQTVVQRGKPSSNLSDQGGQPSFSQKPHSPANASEGGDEISPLLSQEHSVNGNVSNGVEDKLDLKPTVTIGPEREDQCEDEAVTGAGPRMYVTRHCI
ncbi:hypothetical protein ACS0TY_011311 [Phlomoides rotata]